MDLSPEEQFYLDQQEQARIRHAAWVAQVRRAARLAADAAAAAAHTVASAAVAADRTAMDAGEDTGGVEYQDFVHEITVEIPDAIPSSWEQPFPVSIIDEDFGTALSFVGTVSVRAFTSQARTMAFQWLTGVDGEHWAQLHDGYHSLAPGQSSTVRVQGPFGAFLALRVWFDDRTPTMSQAGKADLIDIAVGALRA